MVLHGEHQSLLAFSFRLLSISTGLLSRVCCGLSPSLCARDEGRKLKKKRSEEWGYMCGGENKRGGDWR